MINLNNFLHISLLCSLFSLLLLTFLHILFVFSYLRLHYYSLFIASLMLAFSFSFVPLLSLWFFIDPPVQFIEYPALSQLFSFLFVHFFLLSLVTFLHFLHSHGYRTCIPFDLFPSTFKPFFTIFFSPLSLCFFVLFCYFFSYLF